MVLIVGITGASGAIYGIRILEVLSTIADIETHLIITMPGEEIIKHETNYDIKQVKRLANSYYNIDDIGACIASGTFHRDGMLIAPCSIKTMSALANCFSDNLLTRAGDVTIKERKPLVLMVRETPLHLGHLNNMVKLAEMGVVILPPIPGFYQKPTSIDDIVNHLVGRALDQFGVKHNLAQRWLGTTK